MRLIDADALKDKWQNDLNDALENGADYIDNDIEDVYRWFAEDLEYSPTIDPVKHGKWIDREKYRTTKDGVFHTYRFKVCSECGRGSGRKMNRPTHFCPNCGARMVVKNERKQRNDCKCFWC